MSLTYSMVKRAAAKEMALNDNDSTRITDALNEAQERLLDMGKWKGAYQKYRFCVNEGCITLPREVEGIEAFAVESSPGTVRNQWFEFLEGGPGVLSDTDCIGVQLFDRGLACAFDDVRGTGKKLAVYSEKTEATTATILLNYYDSNGNQVRTQQSGAWVDGEVIILPTAGGYAYSTFEVKAGGLISVIKPITNGTIRLYEYTVATGALKPLAYYAPTETVPEYRRALIPNLSSMGCGDCDNVTVDVIAKLKALPLTGKDNEFLTIRSLGALKLACKALKHEAANDLDGASKWWGAARAVLDTQLRNYLGDGVVQPVRTPSPEIWGGAVLNLQ